MPRIACWRSAGVEALHRLHLVPARAGHAGRRRRLAAVGLRHGDAGGLAPTRCDLGAQHAGSQGASGGRAPRASRQRASAARAVAALRLVQAEIEERARIVRAAWPAPAEGLDGGLGHHAVGLQGQRLAQRRQRLGIVGLLGEPRARGGDQPAAMLGGCAGRMRGAPSAARRRARRAGRAGRPGGRGRGRSSGISERRAPAAGGGAGVAVGGWRAAGVRSLVGGGEDAALDLGAGGARRRTRDSVPAARSRSTSASWSR